MIVRYTTQVNLRSPMFTQARTTIISTSLTRQAKALKASQVRKNVESRKTGRLYQMRGIQGARRWHRASARTEYPAQITFNLVRSIKDRKLSEYSHAVYQDNSQAAYGKYLIRPRLGRKIMPMADVVAFFQNEGRVELHRLGAQLRGA